MNVKREKEGQVHKCVIIYWDYSVYPHLWEVNLTVSFRVILLAIKHIFNMPSVAVEVGSDFANELFRSKFDELVFYKYTEC